MWKGTKKIQIQEISKEHIDVKPRQIQIGKQNELLRLLTKYDNSNNIILYLSIYKRQIAKAGIYKKGMDNLLNKSNAPRYDYLEKISSKSMIMTV